MRALVVDPDARSLWRQFLRLAHNSSREPKSLGFISLADYWAAGVRRAWATMRMAIADRIEDKLPRIRAPTLVVRGTRSNVLSEDVARRMVQTLADGRLMELDAGHNVPLERPRELADAAVVLAT